ncbi:MULTISPECIES: TetR family transcriptional regulator [Buttiauxella]|jgi:TetR/AcrR family transcriptional repressor of acrEF/envCD operon|uniref:TetR family transcriptional regulator n=1 Tax=Buttiauxella ferragutiae ATCC 51602 TaxID=1354252 RepID=A0ABX2W3I1_9ENTR|nr:MULTISPECIES: TetR family transcriptional regulator [Buttiauxella]AYN26775.1 TetR family transcriptional regulator [Buttiauxella sp. 3AFRM03]MCE0826162.1 TetR family transcriptional regulator [Buttiauxella ferragutiae]OAT25162.1 TetR family transcriptional regulator [Buttiauxella ferragutiae ATCC 51602]TDN52299.1 TetR family transcriptional regulator [Buttiauxella sp. JUb87]UNK59886.1 TetR family transcriptional regulator [Buttiauxella ferragutiae]
MARKTKSEALKTRQHLIDVAITLFAKKGVSTTTLADIADAAGMTRGAIYWHFDSKVSLFNEIWNLQSSFALEIRRKLKTQTHDNDLQLFREIIIETLKFISTDHRQRELLQILYHSCEFNGEMYSEREIRERIWFNRERMKKLLRNCISKGLIPVNTNIELMITIIHGYLSGIVKNWLMRPENLNLNEQAPEIADNLLVMLRKSA